MSNRIVLVALGMLGFAASAVSPAIAEPKGGGSTAGGACHVVSGPNAGKSGTYDSEGACCNEAVWGCTECGGSNTGKCKDGAKTVKRPDLGTKPAGTLQKSP
jgi:hypothetical protein